MKTLHSINKLIVVPAAYRAFAHYWLKEPKPPKYEWSIKDQRLYVLKNKSRTLVNESILHDINHYTVLEKYKYYLLNPFELPENMRIV